MAAEMASGEKRMASISVKSAVVWIKRLTTSHSSAVNRWAGASRSMIRNDSASISSPVRGDAQKARISGAGLLPDETSDAS